MSHLIEQSISYRAVTSWRNNFVRHLRSRHSHTVFPIPRSVDLGFLIIRPLRGRWVNCYIIPQKIRMQADWKKVSTCILTLDHNRLFIYSTFTCYASCFAFSSAKIKKRMKECAKKFVHLLVHFVHFKWTSEKHRWNGGFLRQRMSAASRTFCPQITQIYTEKTKPLMDNYDNYSNLFPDNKKKQIRTNRRNTINRGIYRSKTKEKTLMNAEFFISCLRRNVNMQE